jgi:hypothetical protein
MTLGEFIGTDITIMDLVTREDCLDGLFVNLGKLHSGIDLKGYQRPIWQTHWFLL